MCFSYLAPSVWGTQYLQRNTGVLRGQRRSSVLVVEGEAAHGRASVRAGDGGLAADGGVLGGPATCVHVGAAQLQGEDDDGDSRGRHRRLEERDEDLRVGDAGQQVAEAVEEGHAVGQRGYHKDDDRVLHWIGKFGIIIPVLCCFVPC